MLPGKMLDLSQGLEFAWGSGFPEMRTKMLKFLEFPRYA
jgi:hypothetical protein